MEVPLDGSATTNTFSFSNQFAPSMYYIAVMDCNDEIHNILGSNKNGRIELEAELLANNN